MPSTRKACRSNVPPAMCCARVLELYRAEGWHPVVAPEMEFYLVGRHTDPAKAIEPMMGRTGRPAAARQAYSMSAVDDYGPVIDDRRIYEFAEIQGIEIDGITQEGGAGQLEINLRHGDPLRLADEVFYFKRLLIREAALKHDCFATFMAKPIEGEPGSAMHVHHSVTDEKGRNLFAGPHGGETDAFFHFIGGLQEHMASVIAVIAPYVNSYRRYVRDFAAPINLEWGRDNRTTGLRVPISSPEARRIENRLPGMDCNPYLCIAASLACGYLGMKNEIWPDKRFQGDAYDAPDEIPHGLNVALDLFDKAEEIHKCSAPNLPASIPSSNGRNTRNSSRSSARGEGAPAPQRLMQMSVTLDVPDLAAASRSTAASLALPRSPAPFRPMP